MYSKMHAAIDMHHMNGNMNMINIYTPPAKQYHTPAIHKKTPLYQNSTIHLICTQHYNFGKSTISSHVKQLSLT